MDTKKLEFKLIELVRTNNLTELNKCFEGSNKIDLETKSILLKEAILSENKNTIKFLISNNISPNSLINKKPILSHLISDRSEDAYDTHHNDFTEIETERYLNNVKMLEVLIYFKADINFPNNEGYTPLDIASRCNHYPAIELLNNYNAKHSIRYINYGWKNNSKFENKFVKTNFQYKYSSNFHKNIIQNFNLPKYTGEKLKLDIDYFKKLVIYDDINDLDWENRTPLDLAIEIGFKQAEEFLLKNGGVSFNNIPPIHNEIRLTFIDALSRKTKFPELGKIPILIKENNINEIDSQGLTPLDLACKKYDLGLSIKHKEAINFLKKNGGETTRNWKH